MILQKNSFIMLEVESNNNNEQRLTILLIDKDHQAVILLF